MMLRMIKDGWDNAYYQAITLYGAIMLTLIFLALFIGELHD